MKISVSWALLASVLVGCGSDAPEIVGTWQNANGQQMSIGSELRGQLSQSGFCAPVIGVNVRRGPYDSYAVHFDLASLVSIPANQIDQFPEDFTNYCASDDSSPMCRFCRIEGDKMSCEAPLQSVRRAPVKVQHNCEWTRISTETSSIARPASCPPPVVECAIDPLNPPVTL